MNPEMSAVPGSPHDTAWANPIAAGWPTGCTFFVRGDQVKGVEEMAGHFAW
jgi:hypothetical protein